MTYELVFDEVALKEWKKLGHTIRADMKNAYKIKLRDSGYRLVCEVNDNTIAVLGLSVGKRDKSQTYVAARQRK